MPAKKQGSTKRNEQPRPKEDDSATAKAKEQAFVWTDDETELLLKVTLEYKVAKAAESVDWESIRSKYQDILSRLKVQMPSDPEEAKRLNKDYPHSMEEINKQTLATKLKAIRLKYRQAVDSGKRSDHGRVVLMYFELCEKIWGVLLLLSKCKAELRPQTWGRFLLLGPTSTFLLQMIPKQAMSTMLTLAPIQ